MSAKRHPNKKSTGQKKIVSTIAAAAKHAETVASDPILKSREEAIVRQFHRIQRGYSILMSEVAKEFDLVKGWIEKEALIRRDELKARFVAHMPRI
jgi:hypothetical protein